MIVSPIIIQQVSPSVRILKNEKNFKGTTSRSQCFQSLKFIPGSICHTSLLPRYCVAPSPNVIYPPKVSTNNFFKNSSGKSKLNPLSRPFIPGNRIRNLKLDSEKDKNTPMLKSEVVAVADEKIQSIGKRTAPTKNLCFHNGKIKDILPNTLSSVKAGQNQNKKYLYQTPFDFSKFYRIQDKRIESFLKSNEAEWQEYQNVLSPFLCLLVDFLCLHLGYKEWRTVAREIGVNDANIMANDVLEEHNSELKKMKLIFINWALLNKTDSFEKIFTSVQKALHEINRDDLKKLLQSQFLEPKM